MILPPFDTFEKFLILALTGGSAIAGTLARASATVSNLGPLSTLTFNL